MDIIYRPIGVIHSHLTTAEGAPIQGRMAPETEGWVEVFPEYEEGLADLESFSHVILLYHFHRTEGCELTVTPFLDDRPHGVFATRAPKRPNSVGLSVVRLVERNGRRLRAAEMDILDQTPLLDIKPYVPAFDYRDEASGGWVEEVLSQAPPRRTRADDRFN